eukprot:snap_masked-scaffold_152-processed-gene-0.0-mRNA-1 protein AED:1.00 eAED:1.00 QI:0/-1/0/0/-1/1/1/0/210
MEKFDWENESFFKVADELTANELQYLSEKNIAEIEMNTGNITRTLNVKKESLKIKRSSEFRTSSYEIFCQFARTINSDFRCEILSENCFKAWVNTRKRFPKQPELSFRKALIAHLGGKDGRKPFPPELEEVILQEVRTPQIWPCFKNSVDKKILNIGCKKFRGSGYHELQNVQKKEVVEDDYSSVDCNSFSAFEQQLDNLFDILQKEGEF